MWQGAINLCDTLIIGADPDIAAEREAKQLRNRDVTLWERHGATTNLTAKLDSLDARYLDKTVGQIAAILRCKAEYRAVAGDVLRSNPAVGAADIEGIGAVAIQTLKELLDGKQVTATPVIDLNTVPAEHQYRPSQRMREAALLVFPKEAFPFSNRTSRGLDLDHTTAFQGSCRDPQTRLGNLGPIDRRIHRAKTAGFWKCQQPVIGTLVWISPLGFRYLVESDGTRRLE